MQIPLVIKFNHKTEGNSIYDSESFRNLQTILKTIPDVRVIHICPIQGFETDSHYYYPASLVIIETDGFRWDDYLRQQARPTSSVAVGVPGISGYTACAGTSGFGGHSGIGQPIDLPQSDLNHIKPQEKPSGGAITN